MGGGAEPEPDCWDLSFPSAGVATYWLVLIESVGG